MCWNGEFSKKMSTSFLFKSVLVSIVMFLCLCSDRESNISQCVVSQIMENLILEFIWFANFLRKTKWTHPSGTCPENQEVFLCYYYTVILLHIPYHNWLIKNSWSYIFICKHQNGPLLRLFFNHRCSFPLTLDSSITHKSTLRCSAQLLLKKIDCILCLPAISTLVKQCPKLKLLCR